MSGTDEAWAAAQDAAAVLGPESNVFARLDPVGFGSATLSAMADAAARPGDVMVAAMRMGLDLARVGPATLARFAQPADQPYERPAPDLAHPIGGRASAGASR